MSLSISPILPATQPASLAAALQPGTVVSAQVLQLLDADLVRIAIASLTLDVATSLPLQVGQTLQLAVTQTADGLGLAPVLPEATSAPRGEAVVRDDIPLAPKLPGPGAIVRMALSPAETDAVATAAQSAVTKQTGLSPLFANLASAVASGVLPPPVVGVAAQLLGLRVPSDRALTGADIKAAMASSGLVMEASLATAPPSRPVALPDLKAALTVLRRALSAWIDDPAAMPNPAPQTAMTSHQAALPDKADAALAGRVKAAAFGIVADGGSGDVSAPVRIAAATVPRPSESDRPVALARQAPTPPPPFRDALPSAQAVASPSLAPDAEPVTVAQQLMSDTDGAVARQTLLQIASLPEQVAAPRNETTQPRWNFEIPFVTAQGTAMAQFAISRDGAATEADPAQRVWRARFSLDIEPAGPVHALISFSNDTTSVKMWAERPATAAQLRANAGQLGDALHRADLTAGDIVIAHGTPAPTHAAPAGHFLDRAS